MPYFGVGDFDRYINHKCIITIDVNGNQIPKDSQETVEYILMDSEQKIPDTNLKYIGYGKCVSVFDALLDREIEISGNGYFYAAFKK